MSRSSCHTLVMADVLSSPKPSLESPTCEPISYLDGGKLWAHTLVPVDAQHSYYYLYNAGFRGYDLIHK